MRYTHKQINKWLRDATEEASRVDSSTKWEPIGNNWWTVRDDEGNLIGWVDASICCDTGKTVFKYRKERTYFSLGHVNHVVVDAPNLSDAQELQKLIDFDAAIISLYNFDD